MPKSSVIDNKRIAKNTLYLYLRMFITMWITLYIPRFLLQVLGVDDYGLYSVVGGIALMFSFINSSLIITSERFLATTIVKNDDRKIKEIFSICINIHLILSVILLLLCETIGLWLLNNKIVIPEGRMYAANVVYQFSVLSCIIGVINAPFHAATVAYEKMSFFAIEGIIVTFLKLGILGIVWVAKGDSLIVYAAAYTSVSLVELILNTSYCKLKLKTLKYIRYWNKRLSLEIFHFAGLNILKNGALVLFVQGSNIILNIFGGIVVSAAYGICSQVYGACMAFMRNVQSAFYPQIMKAVSAEEYDNMYLLVRRAAKFSGYMLMLIIIPVLLNLDTVFSLWLGVIPEYTIQFSVLIIIVCLLETISDPLNTTIFGTGKVVRYQISSSIIWFVSLGLVYLSLVLGFNYDIAISIRIVAVMAIIFISLYLLKSYVGFPWQILLKKEILSLIAICTLGYLLPALFSYYTKLPQYINLITSTILSWIVMGGCILWFGLSKPEFNYLRSTIKRIYSRK